MVVVALALAATSACGADRSASVPTRPTAPPTRPSTSVDTSSTTDEATTTDVPSDEGADVATAAEATIDETTTSSSTSTTSTTTTTTQVAPVAPAWTAFDEALASRLLGAGDFAASVAVAVDGEIVHEGAFGYRVPPPPPPQPSPSVPGETPPPPSVTTTTAAVAPAEPPEAVELGDRFRIASISKVITATVVLQLVEAGQLALDEPVGGRLAAAVGADLGDPAAASMTVRQLLSHTAGFPSYQRMFFGGSVDSCPSMARVGLSSPLATPPGTTYTYSNLNYCLLGLLIEEVAGRPYEAVVQDRLLEPLRITGMRLAGTFDPDPLEVIHPSVPGRNYMEVLGAAGSWVATAADIVTILDALDTTKSGWHPLSKAMVELMRQPAPPPVVYDEPEQWYGLGLFVYLDGAFGHTGTIENTHAMALRRPDGVTWSVLVSGEAPWETEDLRRIFDEAVAASGVAFR